MDRNGLQLKHLKSPPSYKESTDGLKSVQWQDFSNGEALLFPVYFTSKQM